MEVAANLVGIRNYRVKTVGERCTEAKETRRKWALVDEIGVWFRLSTSSLYTQRDYHKRVIK